MNDQDTSPGLQGSRLPAIASNGAEILAKEYRDRLINVTNAVCNLEVIVPQTDGVNVLPPLKAQIDISELAMRITLPPQSPSGSSSAVPFSGSGAPTSSTLSSAETYVAGPIPSLYVDMTGLNLWVCTTAGSNTTSVWSQISGGGGGSGSTPQLLLLVSDAGSYWVAKATGAAVNQNIAKPGQISTVPASRVIRGVTYTYTYAPVTVGSVTGYYTRLVSGSDGSSETNVLIPDPIINDSILATPYSNPAGGGIGAPLTILAAALASGGTSYTAGQVLTIAGGTIITARATITVNTVDGSGAILTCTLTTPGSYSALPGLSGATVTSGSATFNLTAAPPLIDLNIDARYWAK
jgi:hypothetical protein